jgi:protein-disulfide isomerase
MLLSGQTSTAPANNQQAKVVLVLQTATPEAQAAAPQPLETQPTTATRIATSETLSGAPDYARMGEASAPLQIVVFADPQCPYCKQHALETLPPIIETYVKTGKAALTYRHFSFLGEESHRIASAMACAGQQSREAFWVFHDHAYANQFAENGSQANDEVMLAWAKAIQLDEPQFKTCLGSDAARAQVDADTALGHRLRVAGTPTLFINGRALPGALSYEFVRGMIEAELLAISKR